MFKPMEIDLSPPNNRLGEGLDARCAKSSLLPVITFLARARFVAFGQGGLQASQAGR